MPLATRLLLTLATLLTTPVCSSRAADGLTLPLALQAAADRARASDTVRPAIIAALQHGDGEESTLILDNTREAWPEYARFATSAEADLLSNFAEFMHGGLRSGLISSQEYSANACPVLKPLLAVAASLDRMKSAGAELNAGYLLAPCSQGYCVDESVEVIGTECGFDPFTVPIQQP
jgi:hypothetical protein